MPDIQAHEPVTAGRASLVHPISTQSDQLSKESIHGMEQRLRVQRARERKKKKASDNLAKRGEKGGISMFLQG